MIGANLARAFLGEAKLKDADLSFAVLDEVVLCKAEAVGTSFRKASTSAASPANGDTRKSAQIVRAGTFKCRSTNM